MLSKFFKKPANTNIPTHQDTLKTSEVTGDMLRVLENFKRNGLKCAQILDVGAHIGNWSRLAKKVFPTASFHMIEPQTEMKEHLELFCQQYPSCSYSLAGAGKQSEIRHFTVRKNKAGSTFLPLKEDHLEQRDLRLITIDSIIEKGIIKTPELIKLDIQGFELEALKGAEHTFGKTEVYILEVSLFPFEGAPGIPIFSDVINFMLERGYVVYDFAGFLRRPLDQALGQCDICFVKKDSFLRASNKWQL